MPRALTRRLRAAALALAFCAGWVPLPAPAQMLPPGFSATLLHAVAAPTALAQTPDGRILITQQTGALRVAQGGMLLATPALTLGAAVLCSNSERGLLGVAVDPQFALNRFIYLFYTYRRPSPGDCSANTTNSPVNRVSRFVLQADNAVAPGSETVLIDNVPSPNGNHNAGDLQFGKDGFLYVSTGDGGCDYAGGGCAGSNDAARDEFVLLGKILRIDGNGGIPATNPFQGPGTARCNLTGRTTPGNRCQETFAWGLRNPFRIAMDPNAAATRLFINDVGQDAWEEIDEGQAGADYGWSCREGAHVNAAGSPCSAVGTTDPLFEYAHGTPIAGATGCDSITGGAFVPNGLWPGFDGSYLFADYGCGVIIKLAQSAGVWSAEAFVSGLGAGSATSLRFMPYGGGVGLHYTTYADGGQVRVITRDPPPGGAADIDGDGRYDALTDGLLLLRHLFGLSGPALTAGALGANALRTVPADVAAYIAGQGPAFDVDADGSVDALTDGLLVIRYLFGLRGAALTQGAIGAGATRNGAQIEAAIAALLQ